MINDAATGETHIGGLSMSVSSSGNQGFTLIELAMVILLIGFMLTITLPRLQNLALSDNLKTTMRTLTSTINEIKYQAIKDNQTYYLKFDFSAKKFWADSPSLTEEEQIDAKKNSIALPSDVNVTDIEFKDGQAISTGEVSISVNKNGYIDPSVIHLSSNDGRRFTFVLRPFMANVNVLENYVNIDDVKL
jgi:prepilin-type N-terminal cleavage/methylation domain-containing protein